MKSIFSLAMICAFAVSTVCFVGCSDPATTAPEKDMTPAADKDMDKDEMAPAATDDEKTEMKKEEDHGSGKH